MLLLSLAFAQSQPPDRHVEIDFDALRLTAEVPEDGAEIVIETRRPDFIPMIKLRRDFTPEMTASLDEVR